jgi:xanthine dehydrogenase YagR molybdenum-binding subunit
VVVAQTLEQAAAAARLVEADYDAAEPLLDLDDPRAERVENASGRDLSRGDIAAGLAAAEVVVAATYTTPVQTNNPLGLFASIAYWDGDLLTVHDSTQGPAFTRAALAVIFVGEPEPMNPIGVKGIGEVAIVGVAPAIANVIFHATGRRIRSLPITAERLL